MSATIHYRDGDKETVYEVQIDGPWVLIFSVHAASAVRIVNGLLVKEITVSR